jgi:putative transposase
VAEYGTKWPKAVAKLTDDLDVLLEFYNFPRRALGPPAYHG